MGRKLLYSLIFAGTLFYLVVVLKEIADPFSASKNTWQGDLDNSLWVTGIQLAQLDLIAILILMLMVNQDVKSGRRVFITGILAILVLGGISLGALFSSLMKEPKSLGIMVLMILKSGLCLYLAGKTLKKIMYNW